MSNSDNDTGINYQRLRCYVNIAVTNIVVLMKALIVIICTLYKNPLLNTTGDCDSGNYKSVVRL